MAERPGDGDGGGFLSRWSRRKAQARQGVAPEAEPPAPPAGPGTAPARAMPNAGGATAATAAGAPGAAERPGHLGRPGQPPGTAAEAPAPPAPPPPTMDDVARLTKDSDYAAFTSPQVDPQVRNAALKKLFHSEPQFNVMDGLDVYIDDYSQADPLPLSTLRQMQQARLLGLLDDELVDQDKPLPDPPATPAAAAHTPPPDEDAALQLQPHDAAGRPDPGPGAGQPGGTDQPHGPGDDSEPAPRGG